MSLVDSSRLLFGDRLVSRRDRLAVGCANELQIVLWNEAKPLRVGVLETTDPLSDLVEATDDVILLGCEMPRLSRCEVTLNTVDLEVLDAPEGFKELLVQHDGLVDGFGQWKLVFKARGDRALGGLKTLVGLSDYGIGVDAQVMLTTGPWLWGSCVVSLVALLIRRHNGVIVTPGWQLRRLDALLFAEAHDKSCHRVFRLLFI